jgi:hypothetical protein
LGDVSLSYLSTNDTSNVIFSECLCIHFAFLSLEACL